MKTNFELELHRKCQGPPDEFFEQESIFIDWDHVRRSVKEGFITVESALNAVKTYEPLLNSDRRDHAHWCAQQRLRLALLHQSAKPLELDYLCKECAVRKADPLHGANDYNAQCLNCVEVEKLSANRGGRGSCEFLKACYNPRTLSWGLLYYWSHGQDPFLFWLADFYKTYAEAVQALLPIARYHSWLDIKYNGMLTSWLSFSDLLPIENVMKLNLPMTPEKLEALLRQEITSSMQEEHALMSYYVRDAMDEHRRSEED